MENNLIITLLEKASSRDKNLSAVYSEMIERNYAGADANGKKKIDKILMHLTGKDMTALLLSASTETPEVVFEAILDEDFLGYDKGATIITTGCKVFGLIKEDGDEFWGHFVSTSKPKTICEEYCKQIKSAETLSELGLLIMKGLLKLPVNYFD